MTKGYRGESCADAIRSCFGSKAVQSASEIFDKVKQLGDWRAETIWQHLISLVVNLTPARHHWPASKPFLFLRPDGRYELYSSDVHPCIVE